MGSRDKLENAYTHTHMKRRRVSTRSLNDIFKEIHNAREIPNAENKIVTVMQSSDDETISVGLDIDVNLQNILKSEEKQEKENQVKSTLTEQKECAGNNNLKPLPELPVPTIYSLQEIENYNKIYEVNDFGL